MGGSRVWGIACKHWNSHGFGRELEAENIKRGFGEVAVAYEFDPLSYSLEGM